MLDLVKLGKSVAALGFNLGASVAQTVTVSGDGSTTYNPATDSTTVSGGDPFPVTALVYDEEIRDPRNEESPVTNRRVALIQKADIPAGRTIQQNATLTESGGDVWHIDSVSTDPAGATVTLVLK